MGLVLGSEPRGISEVNLVVSREGWDQDLAWTFGNCVFGELA